MMDADVNYQLNVLYVVYRCYLKVRTKWISTANSQNMKDTGSFHLSSAIFLRSFIAFDSLRVSLHKANNILFISWYQITYTDLLCPYSTPLNLMKRLTCNVKFDHHRYDNTLEQNIHTALLSICFKIMMNNNMLM